MLNKHLDKQYCKDAYLTTLFGGVFLSMTFFILLLAVILDKDMINTIILSIFFITILILTITTTKKRYREYKELDDYSLDMNDIEIPNKEDFLKIIHKNKVKQIKEYKVFSVFILIIGILLCVGSAIMGLYGYKTSARYFDIAVIIIGVLVLIASIIASKFYTGKINKIKDEIDVN